MAQSFMHTLRSLEHRDHGSVWLTLCLVMLGAWLAWLTCARVDVQAGSHKARVEVFRMAHRAAAQEAGRITQLRTELGRFVTRGDVLAALDDTLVQRQLAEEEAHLAGLAQRSSATRAQLEAEAARRRSQLQVSQISAQHKGFALESAQLTAAHKQLLADVAHTLHERAVTSRVDLENATNALAGSRVLARGAELDIERERASGDLADKSELARIAELQRQLADLTAEQRVRTETLATLRAKLERMQITAPASGKLGHVATLQVGDVLKSGDVIATVIPPDDVQVVAEFEPDVAVGRIVPGQAARVRLHGFSWVEFGMIDARVVHVASEPSAGKVRVELVLSAPNANVPLQHGLTASVAVSVEHTSPWALVRRSIGRRLANDGPHSPSVLEAAAAQAAKP